VSVETVIYKSPFETVSYTFDGGYPTPETALTEYDEADLNRAVQAYRFFYPSVSGLAIYQGFSRAGGVPNRVFGVLEAQPRHVGFTLNSDTPYGTVLLDLRDGPFVVELPPGPLMTMVMDLHQRWVADLGLPGPDAGRGGKHLIVPPHYEKPLPSGYNVGRATTYRVIAGVRALPLGGDVKAAIEQIRAVKIRPLDAPPGWLAPEWVDMTPRPQDTTPLACENGLGFWDALHQIVDSEPVYDPYRNYYGELAELGIVKGRPFTPDARMRKILLQAAQLGNTLLRIQSFADRRPDRVVWNDRKWEWVGLVDSNGAFDAPTHTDLAARETWFFQAIGASPAMFRRKVGFGSLYWLGTRDRTGAYLDGRRNYRLVVPGPVPASLFWSITVYDAETRSQVQTDQGKAALRSLFELAGSASMDSIDLYFGPDAPAGKAARWIKTLPRKGWFAYFRVYGPTERAFDGTWKPGDFEAV